MKATAIICLGLLLLLPACRSRHASTIQSTSYSEKDDLTQLTVLPFGAVNIPGKWTPTHYNSASKQHFFKKNDVTLAVAVGPLERLPGRTPGEPSYESVQKFYEWDSVYLVEKWKGTREILKQNPQENYLVWQLTGGDLNEVFLYGAANQSFFSFLVNSPSWDQARKIEFVEQLFRKNR